MLFYILISFPVGWRDRCIIRAKPLLHQFIRWVQCRQSGLLNEFGDSLHGDVGSSKQLSCPQKPQRTLTPIRLEAWSKRVIRRKHQHNFHISALARNPLSDLFWRELLEKGRKQLREEAVYVKSDFGKHWMKMECNYPFAWTHESAVNFSGKTFWNEPGWEKIQCCLVQHD